MTSRRFPTFLSRPARSSRRLSPPRVSRRAGSQDPSDDDPHEQHRRDEDEMTGGHRLLRRCASARISVSTFPSAARSSTDRTSRRPDEGVGRHEQRRGRQLFVRRQVFHRHVLLCAVGGWSASAGMAAARAATRPGQATHHINPLPRDTFVERLRCRSRCTRAASSSRTAARTQHTEPERAAHPRQQRRHDGRLRMHRAPDVDRNVDERHVGVPNTARPAASFSDPGPPDFRTNRYRPQISQPTHDVDSRASQSHQTPQALRPTTAR